MGLGDWTQVVSPGALRLRSAGALQGVTSLRGGDEGMAPGGTTYAIIRDVTTGYNTGSIETRFTVTGTAVNFALVGMVTKVGGVYADSSECYKVRFLASSSTCTIRKGTLLDDGTAVRVLSLGETLSSGDTRAARLKWQLDPTAGWVMLSVYYGTSIGAMSLIGKEASNLLVTGGEGTGFQAWYGGGEPTQIKYTTYDETELKKVA